MKRIFAFAAAAALVLGLCACHSEADGGTAPTAEPEATAAPTEAPTEPPATAEPTQAPEAAPANVTVALADGTLTEGSYDEYADEPTGYEVNLVLTTDAAVTDFQVLGLTLAETDENGEMRFDTETLYSAETFGPERPLMLTMTFAGLVPERGIAYTDTDGSEKRFSLELSGEDGSPLLVPMA